MLRARTAVQTITDDIRIFKSHEVPFFTRKFCLNYRLVCAQKYQIKNVKSLHYLPSLVEQVVQVQKRTFSSKHVTRGRVVYNKPTAPGDKKDVSDPLPERYSSAYVEAAWYPWWQKMGFFKPEYKSQATAESPRFTMCLPPPNVTGNLHLGHTLTVAIQDSLIRWHRMRGDRTLWVPGCDHAGIATQVVVEKSLLQEKQLSRHDLGREKFVEEVWKWKNEKGDKIYNQLKKIGASLDWDRASFTMDEAFSTAVKEAFIRLHDEGVIYRSNRLVNWSCALKSAISDIEVEQEQISGRTKLIVPGYDEPVEFGTLVYFSYPVDNGDEITVATTRLETMLGDTAIAVNPDDDRYKKFIGRYAIHPFNKSKLPILSDVKVDMSFGTGAVKITPAHDYDDYEMGSRHTLNLVSVIDEAGFMTGEHCVQFKGMKRFHARVALQKALEDNGLYKETQENPMVIPICSRSADVVEPLLKPQWYMSCESLAKQAVQAVETGELKIKPEMWVKTWDHWLKNIEDWCISRQLWWGHRIPAYLVTIKSNNLSKDDTSADGEVKNQFWISAHSESEAKRKASKRLQISEDMIDLKQDDDVLDTWFSSALFPFAVYGWPNQTDDLDQYYPCTVMETGRDILFFWVARMVLMGLKLTNKLPFNEVYLHSLVHDAHGRKMSKSLGNVIDPLDVIHGISLQGLHDKLTQCNTRLDTKEIKIAMKGQKADFPNGIPECGTDALRFTLCTHKAQGQDVNLNIDQVQEYVHFCNKIWNAAKFTFKALGKEFIPQQLEEISQSFTAMDHWILCKLSAAAETCNAGFQEYDFPSVTGAVYKFWVHHLCDVYMESIKAILRGTDEITITTSQNVLHHCLDAGLCLASPIMPYLTEELYQRLPRRPGDNYESVCVAAYPSADKIPVRNSQLEEDIDYALGVVHSIRSLQGRYGVRRAKANVTLCSDDTQISTKLNKYSTVIAVLSRCPSLTVTSTGSPPTTRCAKATIYQNVDIYLNLQDAINVEEALKVAKNRKDKLMIQRDKVLKGMNVEDYIDKVPQEARQILQQKLDKINTDIQTVDDMLRALSEDRL